MKRLVKVTGFLICEDDFDESQIEEGMPQIAGGCFDCIGKPFQTDSVPIECEDFDNHPLNLVASGFKECDKFFQEVKEQV